MEGLRVNVVIGTQYIGAYVGLEGEKDNWVRPQVKKWAEGVRDLEKVARRNPQMAYASIGVLLQFKWQCLQRNFPLFGALMEPIE